MDIISILGIKTPGYELVRHILGDIDFDRVALMTNKGVHIYWVIPSSNPYTYMSLTKMSIYGCEVYAYNVKPINIDPEILFVKKTSILNQYNDICPDGIVVVNKILEKCISPKELSSNFVSAINLSLISYSQKKIDVSEIPTEKAPSIDDNKDLLNIMIYNPKIPKMNIRDNVKKDIYDLINSYEDLLRMIFIKKIIKEEELYINRQIVDNIKEKHFKDIDIRKDDNINLDKDIAIIYESKSGDNIRDTLNNMKGIISNIIKPFPIYINDLVNIFNKLVSNFNIEDLTVDIQNKKHYSAPLLVYDKHIDTHITLYDSNNNEHIRIPLNSYGIELLSKEKLTYILEAIDIVDCKDERFDELRTKIYELMTSQ